MTVTEIKERLVKTQAEIDTIGGTNDDDDDDKVIMAIVHVGEVNTHAVHTWEGDESGWVITTDDDDGSNEPDDEGE